MKQIDKPVEERVRDLYNYVKSENFKPRFRKGHFSLGWGLDWAQLNKYFIICIDKIRYEYEAYDKSIVDFNKGFSDCINVSEDFDAVFDYNQEEDLDDFNPETEYLLQVPYTFYRIKDISSEGAKLINI